MDYFREIFYIVVTFLLGYLIFKNDLLKLLSNQGVIDKDFNSCYILKYPRHAELHNKNLVYKINIEEFFELNPRLKGKIKIIERPELDSTKADAVKIEVEERKRIKEEYNERNFWEERKNKNKKLA
jgi:hypothetical protein